MNSSTVIPQYAEKEAHVSPAAATTGYLQERLVTERHDATEAKRRPAARFRTTMVNEPQMWTRKACSQAGRARGQDPSCDVSGGKLGDLMPSSTSL